MKRISCIAACLKGWLALAVFLFFLLPLGAFAAAADDDGPESGGNEPENRSAETTHPHCEPCLTKSNRGLMCDIVSRDPVTEVRCTSGGADGDGSQARSENIKDPNFGDADKTQAARKDSQLEALREKTESAREKAGKQRRFLNIAAAGNAAASAYLFHKAKVVCQGQPNIMCTQGKPYAILGIAAAGQAGIMFYQGRKMGKLKSDLGGLKEDIEDYNTPPEGVPAKHWPPLALDETGNIEPKEVPCPSGSGSCSLEFPPDGDGPPVIIGPGEGDRTPISTLPGSINQDIDTKPIISDMNDHLEEEGFSEYVGNNKEGEILLARDGDVSSTGALAGGAASSMPAISSLAGGGGGAGGEELEEEFMDEEEDGYNEQFASGSGSAGGGGGGGGSLPGLPGGGSAQDDDAEFDSFLNKLGLKRKKKAKKQAAAKAVRFGKTKIAPVSQNIFQVSSNQYGRFRSAGDFLKLRRRSRRSAGGRGSQ